MPGFDILFLAVGVVITAILVLRLCIQPHMALTASGVLVGVVSLVLLPLALIGGGTHHHLVQAKSTEFCLSCHVMEPYGESLMVDDSDHVPGMHYQNRRVPRDQACYTCHTSYAMFGDVQAKLNGARHLWVNYVSGIPDELHLYRPYNNRECLSCHAGARSFEDRDGFHADFLEDLRSGETSCLECHGIGHGVSELDTLPRWEPNDG